MSLESLGEAWRVPVVCENLGKPLDPEKREREAGRQQGIHKSRRRRQQSPSLAHNGGATKSKTRYVYKGSLRFCRRELISQRGNLAEDSVPSLRTIGEPPSRGKRIGGRDTGAGNPIVEL